MSVEKSEIEVDLKAAVEAGEVVPEAVVEEVAPDWSPEEAQEAEAMGWIPPERAKKLPEGKSYVGPKEYMERNPLYRKMKDMEQSVKQLADHHQKVSEIEYKKAEKEFESKIADLKAAKVEALDNADHKAVVDIDEEIRTAEKPVEVKAADTTMADWVKENPWYEEDSFLRVEATKVGEILYSDQLYGKPLLDAVKKHLKQAHPEKFKNPARDKPSAVEEGSSRPAAQSKTPTLKDLTADEKQVYKNFERMGVFSVDGSAQKYLNEVIDLRD